MKKKQVMVVVIVLAAVAALVGIVVGILHKGGREKHFTLDEIKSSDEVFLVIENANWGCVSMDEDYWASDRYVLHRDGTIEVTVSYNLSGETTVTSHLTDRQLKSLYEFAYNEYHNPKETEKVDACDGEAWYFTYYEDGEEHTLHAGYTYGIKKYEDIQMTVKGFRP